jgi:hypothetical protein
VKKRVLATGLAALVGWPATAAAHHPGGEGPWSLIMLGIMVLALLAVWLVSLFAGRRRSGRPPDEGAGPGAPDPDS